MGAPHHDIATQAQALTLLEAKIPTSWVSGISSISECQIFHIQKKVKANSYNLNISISFKTKYLSNIPHSKQLLKIIEEMENKIIKEIHTSQAGKEKTLWELWWKFKISNNSICRILHKYNMNNIKPSFKLEL